MSEFWTNTHQASAMVGPVMKGQNHPLIFVNSIKNQLKNSENYFLLEIHFHKHFFFKMGFILVAF